MPQEHTLTLKSPYKSIIALPSVTLPSFVVLTGANGSGKSHALEALKNGYLRSSLSSNPQSEIALYDWNTIIPNDTGRYVPAQEKINRSNVFAQIQNIRQQQLQQLQANAGQLGVPAEHFTGWDRVRKLLDQVYLTEILGDPARAQNTGANLLNQLRNAAAHVHVGVGQNQNLRESSNRLLSAEPMAFLFDDEVAFFKHEQFLWGEVNPFQQAFARLFCTYRDLQRSNLVLVGAQERGILDKAPLDEPEFLKTYGPPPWEFVNSILELNGLGFTIDYPKLSDDASYEPRLTKRSTDAEIRFSDLSSGERILMSFALCLYNSVERRRAKTFPKLLLLDEIDAPLHPSMVRFLLRTIEHTLVRESEVAVILATHKATTVGLAPDDAIYLMNPNGPAIQKTTKSRALSILTEGVPTMSISFDGRHQVFVESSRDAKIYDGLYQRYKSEINSERSLAFIPVGSTDPTGQDTSSGCSQVRSFVNRLVAAGNQTVFGLVDWDSRNNPNDHIRVLCHQRRDALENLILDPVLVIAALAHHNAEDALTLPPTFIQR
jgi:energy-coupling factor transporter ATP-binding protein EcfA2